MFKFLCIPVRDGSGPFLSPPSKIHPGSCPTEHSRLLSPFVLFASSPSINAYSAAPLQCLVPPIVRPPSSVRRRATNPPAPADQCPPLVPRPSVPYAGLHPPPDLYGWWYLAWVWVCVEGRRRRRPPRWSWVRCLAGRHHWTGGQVHAYAWRSTSLSIPAVRNSHESLDSSGRLRPGKRAVVDARILSRVLRSVHLSVCPPHPPPPLPVQPYVSLYSPS